MKIKSVSLDIVCGPTSALPDTGKPEVAFAGKSNVGKSSMINVLINRKALARTSSQPGKTQTINFYHVNNDFYLVDLPGYGYAAASQKAREAWGKMIERYLHQSKQLKAVFLLIDIRHEPSDNDQLMYRWMVEQGYSPVIIATKADKVSAQMVDRQIRLIRKVLRTPVNTPVIAFSSVTKEGTREIWQVMETIAFGAPIVEETRSMQRERYEREKQLELEEAKAQAEARGETFVQKKERWKKTDKPVAKKTLNKRREKKAKKHKDLGKNPNKRK